MDFVLWGCLDLLLYLLRMDLRKRREREMDQKEIGRGEEGDVGREIETYGERGIEFMPCLGLDVDGCRRVEEWLQ